MTPTLDPARLSIAEQILVTSGALDDPEHAAVVVEAIATELGFDDAETLMFAWWYWARPQQLPPEWLWLVWIIRAGRGFGKTRSGAEFVREEVNAGRAGYVSLIAPTAAAGRDVMIEGESGILAVHPDTTRPEYEPSKRRLTWPNGAIGIVYTAEEPDRLRGPQSDLIWADEPASWKTGREAWDNAMLGLRLGKRPRAVMTMTPRPLAWLKELEASKTTAVTSGSTYENKANVAPAFLQLILGRFEGTRLGSQEIDAQYLDDVEGAYWRLATIEATRIRQFDLSAPWRSLHAEISAARALLGLGPVAAILDRRRWRVIVGVDPPGETAECGIVVAAGPERGVGGIDHAVVLDDRSLAGPPEEWGPAVVEAVRYWNAEAAYVESNQGGDMCRSTIHAADASIPVHKIRAKESKSRRAEPIATLYSKGWIHHVGHFPKLEDQMTTWVPTESKSPDRLDACVHALRELLSDVKIAPSRVLSPLNSQHRIG